MIQNLTSANADVALFIVVSGSEQDFNLGGAEPASLGDQSRKPQIHPTRSTVASSHTHRTSHEDLNTRRWLPSKLRRTLPVQRLSQACCTIDQLVMAVMQVLSRPPKSGDPTVEPWTSSIEEDRDPCTAVQVSDRRWLVLLDV